MYMYNMYCYMNHYFKQQNPITHVHCMFIVHVHCYYYCVHTYMYDNHFNTCTYFVIEHCRLIIETPSVDLTPSILPCCVHVHCDSLFTYKDVITTWLRQASTLHDLSTSG